MREISSKDNKIFRRALSLKKKKYRDQYGEYLIEGPNLIKEAIKEKMEIISLFIRPDVREDGPDGEIFEETGLRDGTFILAQSLFKELSDTETPQGMIAEVKKPGTDLALKAVTSGGNIVVLDRLQDPGNIGTILRTADAAGFDLAVFIKGTGDPYSSKVIRSAAGSLFRVPVFMAEDNEEVLRFIHDSGKLLIATAMDGDKAYYECDLSRDCAIVIGNEGNGVSEELLKRADMKIRIPMAGNTESLNASVAAGILMYERIRRQNERSITANPR